jgi:hypothetical protein
MNTLIPERFKCPEQSDALLTAEQEALIGNIRDLIDETRLAALCCELVRDEVRSSFSSMRIFCSECV